MAKAFSLILFAAVFVSVTGAWARGGGGQGAGGGTIYSGQSGVSDTAATNAAPQTPKSKATNPTGTSNLPSNAPTQTPAAGQSTADTEGKRAAPSGADQPGATSSGVSR